MAGDDQNWLFRKSPAKTQNAGRFATSRPPPTEALGRVTAHGWTLSHSPPPYVEELPLPKPPRRPPACSLLILDVALVPTDTDELGEVIGALRREFAMAVFARLAAASTGPGSLSFRDTVTRAGGELLLPGDGIGHRALEVLTTRPDLASDWLGWLRLHREVGPRAEAAIRTLVTRSGSYESLEEMLAEAEMSSRSTRRWLAESRLPPPGAWFRASRILRALLRLQRDPALFVHDVAVEIGYSDSDSLSNQMFRYFAHGAEKGRRLLGLEGRFHAFDRRVAGRRS